MKAIAREQVQTLLLPLQQAALLMPTALVAEVVNLDELQPMPCSADWVLGLLNWRARPVPVISFEALLGGAPASPGRRSKIVVCYPLPGRKSWEFFGVLTAAEPQPREFTDIEAANLKGAAVESGNAYIAMSLRLDHLIAGIPDFEALGRVFYPAVTSA
jgi:chemotaxis signal transduction protein